MLIHLLLYLVVAVVVSVVVNKWTIPFARSIFVLALNLPAVILTPSFSKPERSTLPANVVAPKIPAEESKVKFEPDLGW